MLSITPKLLVVAIAVVGFALSASGCSSRGPNIPETFAVSGKVIYNGKPLADAEVGFTSKLDNKDVKPARGTTNKAGEFTLTTYIDSQHEVKGATPGEFVVTVQKPETKDSVELMKQFQENPAMVPKSLIPDKYVNVGESPLTATVTKGGTNSFEFKLTD